METEGMRGLAFNMQTGLTTEHTPMCGARPAETNHCQVWGSCIKQVPLIREVEPPRNGVGIFGNSASLKKEKAKESKKKKKKKKAQKGARVYDSDDEVDKTPLPKGMFDTFVKNILLGANKNADRKIKEQEEALSDDEFITPQLINEDLKNHLEFYGPNKNADTVLEQIELFFKTAPRV